jgi:hypothetical protein
MLTRMTFLGVAGQCRGTTPSVHRARRDERRRQTTTDDDTRDMFKKLSDTFYGARTERAGATNGAKSGANSTANPGVKSSSAPAPDGDATPNARRKSFSDRFMMSWTDEDVTFLGEDPYGDCAGNVFATVAADEQRRRASVDETRRASADGGSRRTSENGDDFEKASAFWRIGPL